MDENSLFTPFDEITQTRELQMLKTIIPYMPHDSQKQMTLMVHYISLMNSMRMIDSAPAKQEFLKNFAQKEKPKDTTSAMPFLMESIKEAKRNGIEFTKEEVYSMCTELSKDLPEKNRRQVEKLLKML